MTDEEIARLLAHSDHNCQEAVKAFIHLALMRDANDNVTTVVVNIGEPASDDPAEESESETPIIQFRRTGICSKERGFSVPADTGAAADRRRVDSCR